MNIFVDVDGTIIDSFDRHYILLNELLKSYKIESILNKDDFIKYKREGYSNKKYLTERLNISSELSENIQKEWIEKIEHEKYLKNDRLYSDTINFLEGLINLRYNIYLLTARVNTEGINNEIDKLKIKKYIKKTIIVSPQNAILEKANELLKYDNSIMVGDTEVDYKAAKSINRRCYIINRGFRSKNYLLKNGIENFNDLNQVLENIKNEKL